jgi:TonB-dependent receptor-like protein
MRGKGWLCSLAVVAAGRVSWSAEQPPTVSYELRIASQPLGSALQELAAQSGLQIVFFSSITDGLTAQALEGRYAVPDALRALLAHTPLVFRQVDGDTVQIVRLEPKPRASAAPLAAIVVTGTAQGLVATRTETPLREIPQTLTIVSHEQIRQQNDIDVSDVLKHATGVTMKRTNSLDQDAYVRGYR